MAEDQNTPVYDIAFKCLEKFDEIREYHETHDTGLTMRVFEMENLSAYCQIVPKCHFIGLLHTFYDRGNITGAWSLMESSLDNRLRGFPDILGMFLKLLEIILRNLRRLEGETDPTSPQTIKIWEDALRTIDFAMHQMWESFTMIPSAPNFTICPFPDGVQDIKDFRPINKDHDRVPIIKKHSDVKEGITANVSKSLSGEAGILARILNRSVGGKSLKGQKSDDDVYYIEKLETVYFFPNRKYLSDCAKLSDVKDYLEERNYTLPMTQGREIDANAKIDATVPGGTVDVDVQANIAIDRKSALSTKHTKPADFVLGIQTMKLYHRKPSLKSKSKFQCIIFDDDDVEDSEDEEDKFVIADLDDGDMQGLEYKVETGVDGKDVVWIIPSDTV
ncbi:hypothetical protein Egran_02315 [Elaphomyces granulatus]|uniref:Uncharacterized protein n=1 Tax=Elaphomyces granulatus TaxID=519963 RepID=A0A232M0N7_9EURO|nr:hypothetical protein Egran_02315 [Elaphomyces granulatus]